MAAASNFLISGLRFRRLIFFSLKKKYSPADFFFQQWSTNPWPYLYYRVLMACYFVFMVFYTAIVGTLKAKMLIMLTYWSFYILTACQILRAINVWHYIQLKNCNHGKLSFMLARLSSKCNKLLVFNLDLYW